MTNERFAEEIIALTDTLYRVSYSILRDKYDREDAVQSCLEKAWKKRRTLRDERYLKTWLIRILINECYNVHRHKREPAAGNPRADRSTRRRPHSARRVDVLTGKCAHAHCPPLYGGIFHT